MSVSSVTTTLRDSRLRAWEQAKEIAERAASENRALDGEEERQWHEANDEVDRLDERIDHLLEKEKREQAQNESLAQLDRRPKDRPEEAGESQLEEQIRAFLRGDPGTPRSIDVKPPGRVAFRDYSKLSNAAGAYTVPTTFYGQLVEHMIEVSGILQAGPTVLNTSGGEVLQIPKTLTHTPSPAIVLEAGAILESDGTFGQTSLGAFKYGRLLQVSRELAEDTGVDLLGYLAKAAGRALGNAFGSDMIVGAGTTAPRGLILDATVGVTGPTGTTVTFGTQSTAGQGFDLLISLYHSVISPYRASSSCAWVMNDTSASLVRRIKNADGLYAWQPSTQVGMPDNILGKPVYIDPFLAVPAANAKTILFGDFSQYFVRYAGGLRFERSDDFAFANDLITFRALLRADAALVDLTGAVKVFVHSAL